MDNRTQTQTQPGFSASPTARYNALVRRNEISDDAAQRKVLSALEALATLLNIPAEDTGWLSLFKRSERPAPKGIYLWGNVGRGKSMLMDLFFSSIASPQKRRVHFHAFMQEVHAKMHQLRQHGARSRDGADPVIMLAKSLAAEVRLLCFDELQATDVVDATLLYRLFQQLFALGVVIVSTSNHPPAHLYTGKIQAERFDKFIALIGEHMQVETLSSPKDYRLLQMKGVQQVYFSPLGAGADHFISGMITRLCGVAKMRMQTIQVQGRTLSFALCGDSVGKFSFAELCEKPLGPADYLALAQRLDTIILTNIPQLTPEKRNEAKRFVTLIDALYENKTTLICSAAAPAEQLYAEGDGSFEFRRTVSRLMEMQSASYLHENEA